MNFEGDYGMRVIKIIRDVDFAVIGEPKALEDGDTEYRFEQKHGTVLYVAGLVENSEDALMPLGVEDDSKELKTAIYTPYLDFEIGWYKLIGKEDVAKQLERKRNLNKKRKE